MESLLLKIEKFVLSHKTLVGLLIITFFVRIPSLFEPLWYGDEAIYLTIAQKLARGGLMYVDIFDHKTPGIYYLASWTISFLGETIWSFRFLLMVWVLISLVVFYILGQKMFGKKVGLAAAIILSALTSTPVFEGNIANSEILMILPTTLGIIFGLRKNFFISGLFFSLAVLLKFPAVFDFAAFFAFVALTVKKNTILLTIKSLSRLVLGLVVPILVTVVYFAFKGALSEYFTSAFLFNVAYTSYKNQFIIENGLLIVKALPLLALLVYFLIRLSKRIKSSREESFSIYEFLILWLVFSFYGAVFGGRPYEHYLIQAMPAFSLIAAAAWANKNFRKLAFASLAMAIIISALLKFIPINPFTYYYNFSRYVAGQTTFDQYANSFNPRTARNYALASFLNGCESYNAEGGCLKTRTNPGDKVYLYSNDPAIYFLSKLDPAGKYIVFFHIAGSDSAKTYTYNQIFSTKPKYILVESWGQGPFPALEKLLTTDYNQLAFYEDMAIYKIKKSD